MRWEDSHMIGSGVEAWRGKEKRPKERTRAETRNSKHDHERTLARTIDITPPQLAEPFKEGSLKI